MPALMTWASCGVHTRVQACMLVWCAEFAYPSELGGAHVSAATGAEAHVVHRSRAGAGGCGERRSQRHCMGRERAAPVHHREEVAPRLPGGWAAAALSPVCTPGFDASTARVACNLQHGLQPCFDLTAEEKVAGCDLAPFGAGKQLDWQKQESLPRL